MEKKKLIEVALPLEAINNESVKKRGVRRGHPARLHLWWARRPLAAARAVIWSSLVDAPTMSRRDFINTLKRELKPALQKLQASNIAPVDMAQSSIGPGMGVYSRFSKVLEADGTPMSVRSALQIINQELDLYFTEQDGELDRDSRFCVDLYTQYAWGEMKFGEADVLARAKNTSIEKLRNVGILYAEKGVVRLLTREEIG
jgi:putative DNA methylase